MMHCDILSVGFIPLIVLHCYFFGTKIQIRCRGRWTRLASPRFNLLRAGRSPLQKYQCLRIRLRSFGVTSRKACLPCNGSSTLALLASPNGEPPQGRHASRAVTGLCPPTSDATLGWLAPCRSPTMSAPPVPRVRSRASAVRIAPPSVDPASFKLVIG